ncbi:tram-like protein, partial [Campylobacter jejuni]|nr:tram-like protein [Campylobacter jejuni]EDP7995213.1 tram-like protein [Campylobacter jejuni]EIQ4691599.1 tram-like protein [Campylobacter jejuni]
YFFSMASLCSKAKNHLEMKGFNIYATL